MPGSFGNAGSIIATAAIELALPAVVDPYASPTTTTTQLAYCFRATGKTLVKEFDWQMLTQVGSFTTSTSGAALPADFDRFVTDTAWKRTSVIPATPIGAQDWESLQAFNSSGPVTVYYRLRGNKIYAMPGDGSTIYYEYISSFWIDDDLNGIPDTDVPNSYQSSVCLDERLMVTGIKWRWKRDRGMSCDAEQEDYLKLLGLCKAGDKPGRVLSMSGGGGLRLISGDNVPDTGFGS